MALPIVFNNLPSGVAQLSDFDINFNAVAALGTIPCSASGTNTIALTPIGNLPVVSSYPDLTPSFAFAASSTCTAGVTLNVNGVGARTCYKWNGQQPIVSGDIVSGGIYRATPLQALNGGSGGFLIDSIGLSLGALDIDFLISGGGSAIVTGNKGWLHIPAQCTITAWHVMADQSGSINVDILRGASGVFPVSSIVGAGNAPALSSQQTNQAVPSGWTSTQLNIGDWVAFNVTGSPASVTLVSIALTASRN